MEENKESRSFGMSKRKKIMTRYVVLIAICFIVGFILLIQAMHKEETRRSCGIYWK